jgi:hypothetical protein
LSQARSRRFRCQAQNADIVPGTERRYCTRHRTPILYQVQNADIVPGTERRYCTRHRTPILYQAQNADIVPGTERRYCTRYRTLILYQAQNADIVPGTERRYCTRYKTPDIVPGTKPPILYQAPAQEPPHHPQKNSTNQTFFHPRVSFSSSNPYIEGERR